MARDVGEEISGLRRLGPGALHRRWRELYGTEPPPKAGADFLRRAIAHRLQGQACGGLPAAMRRRLERLAVESFRTKTKATPPPSTLKPGTRLRREWQGGAHEVEVLTDGFAYGGSRFASLSEIARKITGTRWNGPLFFGLRKSGAAAEAGHGR